MALLQNGRSPAGVCRAGIGDKVEHLTGEAVGHGVSNCRADAVSGYGENQLFRSAKSAMVVDIPQNVHLDLQKIEIPEIIGSFDHGRPASRGRLWC
ncbi:hypothetical protein [Microtetraspora sp. NBRC 16547]|uniref:hypothetical protein n=1 Tax=Microtetraspora sp. NBRC 16547 TaxID=3030993 RepID=UPI00255212F4|nr:hypothetical protein [Microtetraspora sp. NBRC 16547]